MEEEVKHEEWRDVVGYEGMYQVSDLGRIKSFKDIKRWPEGRILKIVHYGCYPQFSAMLGDGICRIMHIHRAVARAFLGPVPDKHEVNHKDGNKNNSRLDNLEYVTKSENALHAIHVLKKKPHIPLECHPRGEDHKNSRLTEATVRLIRAEYASGLTTERQLARKFGVGRNTVRNVLKGNTWRHVA